ncbi:hypothetical protein KJ673_04475 [Patescibacteria group bacterium]|nr:hypothetical protein [Patescibacteria group bacterium]
MNSKMRSPDQTATAFSMSKELFYAMEEARAKLQMDRSNFIRYCIAKELTAMGAKIRPPASRQLKVAEKRQQYGAPPKSRPRGSRSNSSMRESGN